MSNQHIRNYKAKDISSIIELFTELQEAEHKVEPNRRIGIEAARFYFNKIQKQLRRKKGKIFVAEHENKIAGLIIVLIETNDIIENSGTHLYISDIVVRKEYQRKWIGMNLLRKAEDFACEQGINEIRVTSLAKNIAALNLYRKANFEDKEILLTKTIGNNKRWSF